LVYIFPVLVFCTKKNLATLVPWVLQNNTKSIAHKPSPKPRPGSGRTWAQSRGRCYDHNFLRFLTIFCEKNGFFLKNQCYDQFFQNLALFWVKNANIFADFFGENIFKIITSVPDITSSKFDFRDLFSIPLVPHT
jgi:hypothetical protein